MKKPIKITHENKVKEESFSRLQPTIKNSPSQFELIHVTNDFLRCLLTHFQQQQRQ